MPGAVARSMSEAGLADVSAWRRGTDVWWYAQATPDRGTAFARLDAGFADSPWLDAFPDVMAEAEAPAGGRIWYEQVFHTDAPAPGGSCERGFFSLVIDPNQVARYEELHADPWPEMLEAITQPWQRAGVRRSRE
jgi:L-rhamnose mutarotase